ncbi:carboxylesterase family protein [Devosia nitrariae]|uniref:Carboxylic ester hydrolase n=1 Tax=Devosia nitrariae TaxID=2071872 RepID=A0ABQ5W9I8_9HYPH|nr:carboxylesterase family protein [Devosia nitrariae]GLQ56441.1 carboxylic ester hydrolase [Devosia nitrariae]
MTGSTVVDASSREATYRGLKNDAGARFLGIRYAEPPIRHLRFKPPAPYENHGLVDASRHRFAPPQTLHPRPDWAPRGAGFETGEDCLNLNVYTPAADDGRRPVIVHAFGGGFQGGSAHGTFHDEAGFARRGNVVLVRPNMRVGALGFLHLGEVFGPDYAAANRGMLDLIAALEWVRDNIAAFGGDPDNVTVVGMSSGSFTIAALFGVDGVADLYRRAWLMSGPASRLIAPETATALAADFLDQVGVQPGNVEALQALALDDILAAQGKVLATHLGERNAQGGRRTFGIVLDGASLQRHPLEGLAGGQFRYHGLVAGWSRDEARMWYASGMMPEVADRPALLASIERFRPEDAERQLVSLEAEEPGLSYTAYEEIFLSRAIYRDPALRTLATHAESGGIGFAYEFRWVPKFEGGRLGAAHGFDEPFVLDSASPERFPLADGDPAAACLATDMSAALIRFAATGEPGWQSYGAGAFIRHWP